MRLRGGADTREREGSDNAARCSARHVVGAKGPRGQEVGVTFETGFRAVRRGGEDFLLSVIKTLGTRYNAHTT